MSEETSKARKSVTAIIRDVGFLVVALGVVIAVLGGVTQSTEWFQAGIMTGFFGAVGIVAAGILWLAGLRR